MGKRASASAARNAPAGAEARRSPRPVGPTSRMSFAKIGSNATAPPRSTAKRSSEIAPKSTRVRRIRRTPASTSPKSAAPSPAGTRPERTASASVSATQREPDADDVDERVLDREQDAAHRGPGDDRELEADRALGERGDEDLLRHERGHQSAARGRPHRAPDPLDEREHEEGPDLIGARRASPRAARRGRACRARSSTSTAAAAATGRRGAPPVARAAAAGGTPRARRARGRAGSPAPSTPASRWRPSPSSARSPPLSARRSRGGSRGA